MATTSHLTSTRGRASSPVRVRALNRPENRVERKRDADADTDSHSRRSEAGLAIGLFVVIGLMLLGVAFAVTWGVSLLGSALGSITGA